MKKDINDSFSKKVYECNGHVDKLNDAKEHLKEIMLLTLEKYLQIDKRRWLALRKVRDHEVDNINFIHEKSDELIEIYNDLNKFIKIVEEKQ